MFARSPLERFLALLARMVAGAVAGTIVLFMVLYVAGRTYWWRHDDDGMVWEWTHIGWLVALCVGGGALTPVLRAVNGRLLGYRDDE